jgi:hypothetical protein
MFLKVTQRNAMNSGTVTAGVEGLRQKGWTLITIALLLYVEQLVGLKSYIIGQGDNQVCKIMIPIPSGYKSATEYIETGGSDLDQKIQTFMDTLTRVGLEIGLVVKPDETCVSRDIMIYGKDILWKGALLPQALKRISRTLPDVNEVYPTLETKIATVQTSGSASSQKSLNYVIPYVVSTTETLVVIMRELFLIKTKGKISSADYKVMMLKSFKEFLLRLSSEMGGCPILNPLHFLYRGHPDHLTAYTTFLHITRKYSEWSAKVYNYLSLYKVEFGNADPELLVCNPCAVNVLNPQTIGNVLRQDLETILIQVTKNRDLAKIFSDKACQRDESFFEYLIGIKPCHPRVLHEILRNTIQGAKLSYISKYKNTKTTRILYGKSSQLSGVTIKMEMIQSMCEPLGQII